MMKTEPIRDQDHLLRFFADYSGFTSRRRQAFRSIHKELHALGIPNFLIYPAILHVSSGGNQHLFDSVKKAEEFLVEARNSHASWMYFVTSFKSRYFKLSIDITPVSLC